MAQTNSQAMSTSSSAVAGGEAVGAWCTSTSCTAGSLLLQSSGAPATPAVFRRLSQANLTTLKQQGAASDVQQLTTLQCQKLEAELQLWKCKHADAVKELDRRQDSYMRREEQLKLQLAALTQTQEAGDSSGGTSSDGSSSSSPHDEPGPDDTSQPAASSSRAPKAPKPLTLQEMQEQVLNGLDDLLQRQKLQMRTEEAQQLRQFRSRLAEIEGQLQACKQAAAAHQGDWMDKTVALRKELGRTQEIAAKLDAMDKLAEEEAAQCRVQFRAQEDDRQHLVRQLIAVKQENSRLKQEHSALQEELDAIIALALEAEAGRPADTAAANLWGSAALHAAGARPSTSDSSLAAAINDIVSRRSSSSTTQSGALGDPAAVQAKMERYSHVIQQLKKLLESERRQLRQARAAYTAELSRRSELQALLLSSIQAAKQQHRAAEAAAAAHQRQQQQAAQPPLWADERPRSTAARIRPVSCRPVTSHSSSSSQMLGSGRLASPSRPTSSSVVQAADGQQPQLGQAGWEALLEQLLVRRDVLELLFSRSFPELMEGPREGVSSSTGGRQAHEVEPAELYERWAACQQQRHQEEQQQQQQQQQQYGLGETSPPDTDHSGVLHDDGLECSDSEGGSSSADCDSTAYTAADEAAAGTGGMSVSGAAADEWCDAAACVTSKQQRHVDKAAEQQSTEAAHVTLSGLSAPVMPSFPARQPLHHTVVRRPRSGLVQHQPGAAGATRRPASAAAAASQPAQLRQGNSPVRPATAACRHALGQQGLLLQPSAAGGAAVGRALQRPGSSSSRKGGGLQELERPLSAGSEHAWNADAAKIAGSFLAGS
ncbi:hypothetical protein OEZ85_008248 [Tetradesmus obliquus]|uniref:Uncharacterized protein n=1 Tax=Tetradesmus obliquus TaxID=3088 RepID=A0ABY8TKJ6_TETOB|nr:hypothetical protein OEZ85_008248 [Tetradesmus obliquus]